MNHGNPTVDCGPCSAGCQRLMSLFGNQLTHRVEANTKLATMARTQEGITLKGNTETLHVVTSDIRLAGVAVNALLVNTVADLATHKRQTSIARDTKRIQGAVDTVLKERESLTTSAKLGTRPTMETTPFLEIGLEFSQIATPTVNVLTDVLTDVQTELGWTKETPTETEMVAFLLQNFNTQFLPAITNVIDGLMSGTHQTTDRLSYTTGTTTRTQTTRTETTRQGNGGTHDKTREPVGTPRG